MHTLFKQKLFAPIVLIGIWIGQLQMVYSADDSPLWIERLLEMTEAGLDEESASIYFTTLSDLAEQPINLNNTTDNELLSLPFLSDYQHEQLQLYLYSHTPLRSIYELKLINGMDYETIQLILPFVYIGDQPKKKKTASQLLAPSRIFSSLRYKQTLETAKGYDNSNTSNPYLGAPSDWQARIRLSNSRHLQSALSVHFPAGTPSPIAASRLTGYIHLRDIGIIKNLTIGDLRIGFGQGLVVNNFFSMGKSASTLLSDLRPGGISYSSTLNPAYALRGVGATLRLGKGELSLFATLKAEDGTAIGDTLQTTYRSPNFRTSGEINHLGQALQWSGGAHYSITPIRQLTLGTTLYYLGRDKLFYPPITYYNFYLPRSRHYGGASIDYRYQTGRFSADGELAILHNRAIATSDRLTLRLQNDWAIRLIYRYFAPEYLAPWGKAVATGDQPNNEHGILIALKGSILPKLSFSSFIDYAQYPRPRYNISIPSDAWSWQGILTYDPTDAFGIRFQHTYKSSEKDYYNPDTRQKIPSPIAIHRLRLQARYSASMTLSFRTQVEYARSHSAPNQIGQGFMVGQEIRYQIPRPQLVGVASIHLFRTDEATPFYTYERSSPYTFSIPYLSGNGIRTALQLRYNPVPELRIEGKLGYTYYTDRTSIGSANDRIASPHKTDLYLTLAYQLFLTSQKR